MALMSPVEKDKEKKKKKIDHSPIQWKFVFSCIEFFFMKTLILSTLYNMFELKHML